MGNRDPLAELVTKAPSGKAFINGSVGSYAETVAAADVQIRPLDPVWPGILWAGKPTLFAGDPGLGKSMLTCDIVARVTTGTPWPCTHERRDPAEVVMLSAEDDPEDTIVPRLAAAGADLRKITLVTHVNELHDDGLRRRALSLDRHSRELGRVLADRDGRVRLVVVDPLSAYLGRDTDSHNEGDVRSVLSELAGLAAEHHAAILAIRHLRKSESSSAQARIIGSIAFTAAARAVYAVARDPDNENRRLLLFVKCNLAPETDGYAYTIETTAEGQPFVAWSDDREARTADDIFAGGLPARPIDEAAEWIVAELADGPIPSAIFRQRADDAGHKWRTIERARREILADRVRIERGGGIGADGHWRWRLLTPPHANSANPVSNVGGLSGDSAGPHSPASAHPKTATPPTIGKRGGLGRGDGQGGDR